jgi:hypothetical protein
MKTITDKNGIERLNLKKGKCESCAFESHWQEYGVWFADCNLPSKYSDKMLDLGEIGGNIHCPFWKRKLTTICHIHKIESIDICSECEYEFEKELNEMDTELQVW